MWHYYALLLNRLPVNLSKAATIGQNYILTRCSRREVDLSFVIHTLLHCLFPLENYFQVFHNSSQIKFRNPRKYLFPQCVVTVSSVILSDGRKPKALE